MWDNMDELTEEELLTAIDEMFEAQTQELTEKQEKQEQEEQEKQEQEQEQQEQQEQEQQQELVEIVEQLHDDITLSTKINIGGYVMLALVLGILLAKVFWERIR